MTGAVGQPHMLLHTEVKQIRIRLKYWNLLVIINVISAFLFVIVFCCFVSCACGSKQYFSGDKIKKNETSGACDKYGRDERCVQVFGGEI
jgi:hypothetical protein